MPDITYDVGRVSFVMKGAWNLATNYEKLDAVTHDGSLYIAKQDVPGGTAISNTTYWQLAAEKGDKGDTGGVNSVNGQQGDVWFPDSRQLISDGYTTDTDPFLMKGNDSDSDRFELAKKLGNTVAVNQQVEHGNFDAVTGWICQNGGTITASGNIGTCSFASNTGADQLVRDISLTNGHTFLISLDVKQSSASAGLELFGGMQIPVATSAATTEWQTLRAISSGVPYSYWILRNSTSDPSLVVQLRNAFVIDLTLWYGSNDRIPSDLLSHPENWGRYFAGSLAYNAGTLESADGTVLTSIGSDGITVLTEVDTGSEVLRSAGSVADEKTPDGTITRRVGIVNIADLAFSYNSSYDYYYCDLPAMKSRAANEGPGYAYIQSDKYVFMGRGSTSALQNANYGEMFYFGGGWDTSQVRIKATTTPSSGVIIYELATPTTEQGTAFDPLVVTVKNGVLSWTNTKGIPVGHESHYFENLRKRVEDRLPDPPSADGTYRLTCTISGGVKTYSWEA